MTGFTWLAGVSVVLASISLPLTPLLPSPSPSLSFPPSLLLLFSLVFSVHGILGSLSLDHCLDPAVTITVRELVQKRFSEVEAHFALHRSGEENQSRYLVTYMIEANLTSPEEALSHEQIIEDVSSLTQSGFLYQANGDRSFNLSSLDMKHRQDR
jgi:hypothetical protein